MNFHILTYTAALLLTLSGASAQTVPADSGLPAPELNKETKKILDKNARDNYKRCATAPDKDRPSVANNCLGLAVALRTQAKDFVAAKIALQRSCSLGNADGCNELGKDLAASGDQAGAMKIWFGSVCSDAVACRTSIFYSLANQRNLHLDQVEKIGLPLCDEQGDDQVCRRLAELGSSADFAAIATRHRATRLDQLRNEINRAEQRAVMDDNSARQMDSSVNQSANNTATALGNVFAAGAASTYRQKAESEREKAARLRNQLADVSAAPIEYPVPKTASVQQATFSGSCATSLSYLSNVIPPYPGTPELAHIREVGLQSDPSDVVRKVKAQGMTIAHAIDLANQQADAAHANLSKIEGCIRGASMQQDGDRLMKMLETRSYGSSTGTNTATRSGQDVLGACVESYVAADWQEVINREVAKQMAICSRF